MTTTTKPKRVRCDGACGALFDPGLLVQVGPKRRLCDKCLVKEAAELVDVEAAELPDRRRTLGLLPDEPVEGWPAIRGRLSPSEISTYLACPEQWRRKRILGERTAPNGSMIAGTAAHHVSEAFWLHKLASDGELLDDLTIRVTTQAAFDQACDEETDRGVTIDWKGEMTYQMAKDAAEWMALSYLREVGPWFEPVATEHVTSVRIPGVPVPVVSIADVLTEGAIVDTKFGKNCDTKPSSFWAVQGLVQQIGQRRAAEWHSVSHAGKVATPDTSPDLRIERTIERFVIATRLVETMYRSMMSNVVEFGLRRPWPGALSHPFACGMCDFRADCSWHTAQPWLDETDLLA